MLKLSKRNGGTAYGARVDGYDFHIFRDGPVWRVVVKELTGQETVYETTEDSLANVRKVLAQFENAQGEHIDIRYREAWMAADWTGGSCGQCVLTALY